MRIRRDYIENGIATIHCCISGYNDIINAYSAKNQESLNFDFVDYLKDAADPIPDECPLVLNIIGNRLLAEEKKIIAETIRDDFSYRLGLVEKEQEREFHLFISMVIGLIISGLLLWLTVSLDEVPREIFIVLFWFFADRMFANANIVFSRETLYDRIWGMNSFGNTSTVAVHINRLREAVELDPAKPKHLITVWGVGYKFKP